jgi:hypothetical protein
VEATYAAIKDFLDPSRRESGRKMDVDFLGYTLKLVDSGSKWILRGPDNDEIANTFKSLREALATFKEEKEKLATEGGDEDGDEDGDEGGAEGGEGGADEGGGEGGGGEGGADEGGGEVDEVRPTLSGAILNRTQYEMPEVGDKVELMDSDEESGWIQVHVCTVRKASFDIQLEAGKTSPQKIMLRSMGWRPVAPNTGGGGPVATSSTMDPLLTKAILAAEELEAANAKSRARVFAATRVELDSKVDPFDKDADSTFAANIKEARAISLTTYPLSKEASKIKNAVSSIQAKRTELEQAEHELNALLLQLDEKPPPRNKQRLQ